MSDRSLSGCRSLDCANDLLATLNAYKQKHSTNYAVFRLQYSSGARPCYQQAKLKMGHVAGKCPL